MKYYHGTDSTNVDRIYNSGFIYKNRFSYGVYVCKSYQDVITMLALHFINEITIFEIDVPDDIQVIESFDHNSNIIKCDAYLIMSDIPTDWITDELVYEYHI